MTHADSDSDASPDADSFYEILGVAPTATQEEIRSAYWRLVAKYHPDHHLDNPLAGLAEAKLKSVNAAYEVLSDPGRRAAHDAERAARARRRGRVVPPVVRREARALAVLLRGLSIVVALVFLARVVPLVWRTMRQVVIGAGEALGSLAGTPAVLGAFLLVATVTLGLALRRRRSRRGNRNGNRP